jgi:PAS domain S-box-containing protein
VLTAEQVRALVHELEVHQIELEMQNAELLRSQQATHDSEERYRQLYELAPMAYLSLDLEGRITSANLAAVALLGPDSSRLVGRKFSAFVAPRDQDLWHGERYALLEERVRRSFALELERPDCGLVEAQVVGSMEPATEGRSGSLHLALLDLTELRRAERALRDVVSRAVLAEQEERRRLASDLHDDAGQLLALASIKLRGLVSAPRSGLATETREIEELLAEAHQRISSLSFQLSPPLLYDVGLEAAAQWLAEELGRRYGLTVCLSDEAGPRAELDETTRVLLFRALRELLLNVAKHAGVAEAHVRILREGERVRVEVQDRGVGFDPEAGPHGFGLLAIRERVRHLGGSIEIQSVVGSGTRVVIQVPIASQESDAMGRGR